MVERAFLGFINDNGLFSPTDRVLLAVSGGLDSMVMTDLFYRTGQPFAIAHVNFGLRGAESDGDAHLVTNKASECGVPFHLIRFDTAAIAKERGISIQMAARDLRYDWFNQLLNEHQYTCVATAHHQNDVLETMLLNLTRGTGLAGLHGIAPRSGRLVRPLLFATRDELAAYATEHAVAYREDSSNADDKYYRNRIRHHVVPVLTELNPGFWQTFSRTVDRLRAAETLMQTELDRSRREVMQEHDGQLRLVGATLLTMPEPAFRLAEWLRPYGFATDQAGQMIQALNRPTGHVFQSFTHRITHERSRLSPTSWEANPGDLVLTALTTVPNYEITLTEWPDGPVDVAGLFTLTFQHQSKPVGFLPPTASATACFNADRIILPITIRPWRRGDRFRPLGLSGSKLVSDLLNALKLSRAEREQTAVLVSGGEIAWVIGRRIGHRVRVTAATGQICEVSVS